MRRIVAQRGKFFMISRFQLWCIKSGSISTLQLWPIKNDLCEVGKFNQHALVERATMFVCGGAITSY